MDVQIPDALQGSALQDILKREKNYAQNLQRSGVWVHLWRITGEYANVSIFDIDDHDKLHQVLSNLPLYPYLTIKVTPLSTHPSTIQK